MFRNIENDKLYKECVLKAIQDNTVGVLNLFLNSDPRLLVTSLNIHNEIPLHLAISLGHEQMVKAILESAKVLSETNFKKMIHGPNSFGYTPLHLAASCKNTNILDMIWNALGDDKGFACKRLTADGKLPLHIYSDYFNEELDFNKWLSTYNYLDKLEDNTIDQCNVPSNVPISFEEIVEEYKEMIADNPLLFDIFYYGCFASNYSRQIIKINPTHPVWNNIPAEDFALAVTLCNLTRQEFSQEIRANNDLSVVFYTESVLNIVENVCTNSGVGACDEHSILVHCGLKKLCREKLLKVPLISETFLIKGGDHGFNVLFRDSGSNPSDYRTWGKNAVVVDAWSGKVFPACDIPKKLFAYNGYKNSLKQSRGNITIPFDPNYHKLILRTKVVFNPSLNQNFSIFPPSGGGNHSNNNNNNNNNYSFNNGNGQL